MSIMEDNTNHGEAVISRESGGVGSKGMPTIKVSRFIEGGPMAGLIHSKDHSGEGSRRYHDATEAKSTSIEF